MKTATAFDGVLFVLAVGLIVKLCAALAQGGSVRLLSALPGEFQYLAVIFF